VVWKEFSAAMRAVEGHNNRTRPSVDRYWETTGALDWPAKAIFIIPDTDRWPKPRALKALPQPVPATTGKKTVKAVSVDGRKYSQRGGYSCKLVGPGLQPKLAAALVEAANYSLASSTWRSYASVWRKVGRVAEETGVKFRLPMTTMMVRTLVGALIKSGLKSGTILSYMSSVKRAHKLSGADPSALEDEIIQAAVKGMKNRESLTPAPRAVMSLKMMSKAHSNLRKLKITSRRKKTIWATMVFMFMGSLRGSEILAPEKKKFDPAKTLMGGDLKVVKIRTGNEEVTTLQLTLKQPKTSKSLPVQVVELPEIGGWMCPVKAYRQWQNGKKNKPTGGKPLFCWEDESLVTMDEINTVLSIILEGEEPVITTRAFRPALPTILARQGASEELLKSLGRWTSRTYLHYVREGRSSEWQGLLAKLRNLKI
jgi:hypothetical protein